VLVSRVPDVAPEGRGCCSHHRSRSSTPKSSERCTRNARCRRSSGGLCEGPVLADCSRSEPSSYGHEADGRTAPKGSSGTKPTTSCPRPCLALRHASFSWVPLARHTPESDSRWWGTSDHESPSHLLSQGWEQATHDRADTATLCQLETGAKLGPHRGREC
jgi:hypothetical protein